MKRRRFLQALALAPLAPKLAALSMPAVAATKVNFAALSPAQKMVWSREIWHYARSRSFSCKASKVNGEPAAQQTQTIVRSIRTDASITGRQGA